MTATALHRSPGVGCPLDGTRRYVQSSAPARHPLEGARGRTFFEKEDLHSRCRRGGACPARATGAAMLVLE